jgi:hypothetical protein
MAFLHVVNPRVYLQGDTVAHKRLLIALVQYLNKSHHICTYKLLAEDKPWGSKHVEDIVKIKILV